MIKEYYNRNKETITNFIWRAIQVGGKQGITFLIFILCAKLLSPYDFGVYNYILAITFFLIIFGDFGISTATSKFVAEYNATDKEKIKYVLFNASVVIFFSTAIITILTIVFGPIYLGERYYYILYLLPLVFLAPLTSLYDGIYRGLKRFKRLSLITLFTGLASIIIVYILIKKYGLLGALISQNLFYLLLVFILALGFKEFRLKLNKKIIKDLTSYSILVGLSSIGYYLYTRVDILVLGHFGYIEEIAYYEIISKIFTFILTPILILGTVTAPNNTKNFSLKKYSYLKNKIKKESLILLIIGTLTALISYLILPLFFRIFFNEYNLVTLTTILNFMLILVPLRFFSSYLTVAYIIPGGFVKISTICLITFGAINLILDILLIKPFGLMGIIYATILTQLLFIFAKDTYFYFKIIKNLKN